jgi:hypothetical protein
MTIQDPTQRAPAGVNAPLAQRRENFLQGRVWLLLDNGQYPLRVLLQPRRAPAARLRRRTASITQPLHPFDHRTIATLKTSAASQRDIPWAEIVGERQALDCGAPQSDGRLDQDQSQRSL